MNALPRGDLQAFGGEECDHWKGREQRRQSKERRRPGHRSEHGQGGDEPRKQMKVASVLKACRGRSAHPRVAEEDNAILCPELRRSKSRRATSYQQGRDDRTQNQSEADMAVTTVVGVGMVRRELDAVFHGVSLPQRGQGRREERGVRRNSRAERAEEQEVRSVGEHRRLACRGQAASPVHRSSLPALWVPPHSPPWRPSDSSLLPPHFGNVGSNVTGADDLTNGRTSP